MGKGGGGRGLYSTIVQLREILFYQVLTVIVFIIIGVLLDVGLVGNPPEKVLGSVFNNGTFHNGFFGVFTVFLLASFSFQGTELVGIAAGESKDPEKVNILIQQ